MPEYPCVCGYATTPEMSRCFCAPPLLVQSQRAATNIDKDGSVLVTLSTR